MVRQCSHLTKPNSAISPHTGIAASTGCRSSDEWAQGAETRRGAFPFLFPVPKADPSSRRFSPVSASRLRTQGGELGFPARAMARSGRGCAKVTPNLTSDPEGTRALNLNVLRRLDPAVADILITAAHVVAYNFDARTEKWVPPLAAPVQTPPPLPAPRFHLLLTSLCAFLQSRKRVEGSLFIVKRFVLCSCALPSGFSTLLS
jgi:hypothetical protein